MGEQMLKRLLVVVALFEFAGSALAQAPAPAVNKDVKPAAAQPAPRKIKVPKNAILRSRYKRMKKMAAAHNAAAKPEPAPAPTAK
jgi:hypothetical protein